MAGLYWMTQLREINSSNVTTAELCPHNLTDPELSRWVFIAFGECVTNLRQWFAFWIGLSSILCWLIAQLPQLVTNCRTGKGDEALSFWFLLQWFLGDLTNLVGSILSKQLATQIVTAVYFVLMDSVTMAQYLYYVIRNQGFKGLLNCFKVKKSGHSILATLLPGVGLGLLLFSQGPGLRDNLYQTKPWSARTLKHLDIKNVFYVNDPEALAGYILGCLSAAFYVMSRVPQIVKNFKRCSVDGLSPVMFILAILGNVTYGLGIFLYSVEPVFLLQKLPWLVGSVGTLFFDFTIIFQFLVSVCRRYVRYICPRIQDREREPLLSHISEGEGDTSSILIQNQCRVKRKRSLSPDGREID